MVAVGSEKKPVLGILGGGQLGRMLALAAAELGIASHVFCPDPESPAFDVCARSIQAAYTDDAALAAFVGNIDVLTYEFENVPIEPLLRLEGKCLIFPGIKALRKAQDRLNEKLFFLSLDIPTTRFLEISSREDLLRAKTHAADLFPALLKTRRFGYDGKGQISVQEVESLETAWAEIGNVPAVLERRVSLSTECSVILARDRRGEVRVYDVVENRHHNQILETSRLPASLSPALCDEAVALTTRLAHALAYVGVLCVEFFVAATPEGPVLLANEYAPRVHNSGHWTQDACSVSQFEQHVRAVMGWPLGDPTRHWDVVMYNLLGAEGIARLPDFLQRPLAAVHLYGKYSCRPGRKMGHVNVLLPPSLEEQKKS